MRLEAGGRPHSFPFFRAEFRRGSSVQVEESFVGGTISGNFLFIPGRVLGGRVGWGFCFPPKGMWHRIRERQDTKSLTTYTATIGSAVSTKSRLHLCHPRNSDFAHSQVGPKTITPTIRKIRRLDSTSTHTRTHAHAHTHKRTPLFNVARGGFWLHHCVWANRCLLTSISSP